ncbi:integrin alpha-L isoform X2 [Rhineura floridana]|uniref:integrin alpha-L isoform X2 n=1 Tax=Rhineura floridana TaxID=261503 RepID=UPI002AC80483|nr:integrin alpha-L isoform X2 [Rhineura floridana]
MPSGKKTLDPLMPLRSMAGIQLPVHLLTLLISLALQGPSPSLGDNIDTSAAALFFSNVSKQFGYQVLQIGKGSDARIIVGAPGEQNSTGKVYQCNMKSEECQEVPLEGGSGTSHLGMTLASDMQESKMIACGPGVAEHCDKNLYLSGICYLFDAKLHNFKNIKTGYQKCLKGNVDLVFLFDGSESMKTSDFNTIKEFMISVMKELHNSTIHFAAVQFSTDATIEFDFNNYTRNPNPQELLQNVRHKKGITGTFGAIKCVVEDVFIPERGMRREANKVIIIITDGDATDRDSYRIIEVAKKKGILRLIIGIGLHFNSPESQNKLQRLASEPTEQFVKVLASFEELKDSFNDLQSKIYAIEGTSDSGSFHLELSSSGLSADISQGRMVLGAVGADNWAGGLLEQQKGLAGERFITTPLIRKEMEGAYLGYALKFVQRQQREVYAVGAPRYQHVGRVLIFEVNPSTTNWTLKQEIPGEQRITGASISPSLMFFGQSIYGKTDLNGDSLTDIAVGALGKVVVLCSSPIVTLVTRMQSSPKEIPRDDVECSGDTSSWQNLAVNLSICFSTSLVTKSYQGHPSANLSFHMEIDRNRMRNRGVFNNGKKVTNGVQKISKEEVCIQESIHITNCIEDYISPIKVFMNFSLEDDNNPNKGNLRPVLSPLSNTTTVEIPFDKHCGEDEVCEADLQLSFHDSGSKELVVFPGRDLNMSLELENRKEDAYFVTLRVPHIPGLSFRKAYVSNAQIVVSCDGLLDSQHFKGLSCNISHAVYKDNTKALIQLRFSILDNCSWGDYLEMEASVRSDNEANDTLHDNKASLAIPVQYPVNIIVKELETSSRYVDFRSTNQENKTMTHSYELTNLPMGAFTPPALTVFVKVPITFPAGLIWKVDDIQTVPPVKCKPVKMNKTITNSQVKLTEQCMSGEYCIYQCDLGQTNSSVIHIMGMMYVTSKIEQLSQFKVCTALWFTFDTRRYTNFYQTQFAPFQVAEVEMIYEMNYLPIIIGSGVGGLVVLILIIVALYKCGFFKRSYKEKMDLQEENENVLKPEGNLVDDAEKAKLEDSEGDESEKETKDFTEPLNEEVETK